MKPENQRRSGALATLAASALCLAALSGCNSQASGTASPGANSTGGAATTPAPASQTATSDATGTTAATPAPAPAPVQTTAPAAPPLTGESCVSSDPTHLCLAIHFVSYKDSNGTPVADTSQAATIVSTMNRLWSQCGIGFQIENYEAVDPAQSGLAYGAASQSQTDQIRTTFAQPSNQLLAVTTGPWGTAVNAWTNMPGSPPYGAVMEASIVTYGDGIIYAHEFGHYLGLDHVADTSNLLDAVIYTSSTVITSGQCQTARDSANGTWSAMLRR